MPSKKDITVRFCLTKGEGSFFEISDFSKEELEDFRKCLSLNLDYRPSAEPSARIVSLQIIYDGITPACDKNDGMPGYFINRKANCMDGYPTPIVRFRLDRSMDEEDFLQCINTTSYCLSSQSKNQNNEEPFFAEDWNGYSSILSRSQRDQVIMKLECYRAYCGKVFHFPDGLPIEGHSIPATEFALKPAKR
jgi:hypothetical protein